MWEIIGTALLSGSAGFVAGAYWIVKYQPARGVDLDEEEREVGLTLTIDTTRFDEAMARAVRGLPPVGPPRLVRQAHDKRLLDHLGKSTHPRPRPYLSPAMDAMAGHLGKVLDEAVDKAARESAPVTHLVRGGYTECCGRRTDKLAWGELVTVDPGAVTCKEVWR